MANVYTPDKEDFIVIPDAEYEDYLFRGYISEEEYAQEQKELAAQLYQEWLANPETKDDRFASLRTARDERIAATDYLMASDYPIDDERRAQVAAYRQALRDLPAQDGAPWDGGGKLTPWPEMPTFSKT